MSPSGRRAKGLYELLSMAAAGGSAGFLCSADTAGWETPLWTLQRIRRVLQGSWDGPRRHCRSENEIADFEETPLATAQPAESTSAPIQPHHHEKCAVRLKSYFRGQIRFLNPN